MAMHFIAGTSWTGAEIDPRTAQRILRIIRILATGRSRPQAMVAADDLAIRTGIHHERCDQTFVVLRDACRTRAVFGGHACPRPDPGRRRPDAVRSEEHTLNSSH